MKKFLLLTSAISIFCLQSVQAEHFDFDLNSLENLKGAVKELSPGNPLASELDDVISTLEKQVLSENAIRCAAIEKAINSTRKKGTYLPTAEFRAATSPTEKLQVIAKFHQATGYTEDEKAAFQTKYESLLTPALAAFENPNVMAIAKREQEYPLRKLTSKLAGIIEDWSSPSLEHRVEVFDVLKNSGVLKTSIDNLSTFKYSPAQEVVNFLNKHPEIDTIVIGCGHFIPEMNADNLAALLKFEGDGCKMCQHPTHHLGEMTLNMGFGEHSDVIGDGADVDIWKAVPQNRLKRIVNETWIPGFFEAKEGLMDLLKAILRPGGEIVDQDFSQPEPVKVLYK